MQNTALKLSDLPLVRGRYTENAPLGEVGWFRAGGKAELLFKPEDASDLADFLSQYRPSPLIPLPRGEREVSVSEQGEGSFTVLGVMSNTIVRDGGVRGVTIRLGKEFAGIEVLDGNRVRAGAAALDGNVAMAAAKAGITGLEFFSGIPGTIGGALRMNAGCYGSETKNVLIEATAIDRTGKVHIFRPCHPEGRSPEGSARGAGVRSFADAQDDKIRMDLSYRHNTTPEDYIFIDALFQGQPGNADDIQKYMAEIKAKRQSTQPIREKTGGSTFANPLPEDVAKAGLPEGTKTWQLIDKAGCRGLRLGGAMMSELHANFMLNVDNATGADLENLGEEVRRRVYENSGITLRWEIKRIGER